MNYSISELRLHQFIKNYLDKFFNQKIFFNTDSFLTYSEEEANEQWSDIMEYDFEDGRLWINKEYIEYFSDLFGQDTEFVKEFLADWFTNKHNVEIKFIESPI
jgi:hypothetical protein